MTPEILQSALTHALALVVAAHRSEVEPISTNTLPVSRSVTWSGRVRGDRARWTSTIALQHASELDRSGTQLARALLRRLGDLPGVAGAEVTGPGFLGFDFRPAQLIAAAVALIPAARCGEVDASAVASIPTASSSGCQGTVRPATGSGSTSPEAVHDIQLAHALGRRVDRNAHAAGLIGGSLTDGRLGEKGPAGPTSLGALSDLGPGSLPLLVLLADHRSVLARTTADGDDAMGLVSHLGELSHELTSFVGTTETIPPVHRPDTDVHRTRRTVVAATTHALHHGLDLLGAPAPERM